MTIWYAYKGVKYNGDNPPFYDLMQIDWYEKIKQDIPSIRQKALSFLNLDGIGMQEYHAKNLVQGTKWEAVSFYFWKLKNRKMIDKGQDLLQYFEAIPGLVSLSISILQPKTRINGHYGDTDAIYRIHIPIHIPSQLPDICGISVRGITRPWAEDDLTIFCDAHFHEAWNMSTEPRIIIIMDVVKEEFFSQTDKICANVLSSFAYRHVATKYKFVKKLPGWAKDVLRNILKLYQPKEMR